MFDLGPTARRVFAFAFFAVQAGLVLSADARPDKILAFRMFNESSSASFQLYREVRSGRRQKLVPIQDGAWTAPGPDGTEHEFRWADHVRFPNLFPGTHPLHTTYGLEAQRFRLQRALDYLAEHVPNDRETRSFVAVMQGSKNGRPLEEVRLSSARRAGVP